MLVDFKRPSSHIRYLSKLTSDKWIKLALSNPKEILIMTPASLRSNYVSEIKKCGDPFYKRRQYWEPINVTQNPAIAKAIANVFNISFLL